MPTHRSAARVPPALSWVRAFGLACLLTALWISLAAAQTRRAAIRVNVTVLDAEASDVLGAARESDAWRITTGRGPELSIRTERVEASPGAGPVPGVAICEVIHDAATRCRDQRLPALQMSTAHGISGLLVRFRREAGAEPGAPVRLTLAYTGT